MQRQPRGLLAWLALGLLEKPVDFVPELAARCLFLGVQLGDGRRVADAGQISVTLPVLELPAPPGALLRLAALEMLRAGAEFGVKPIAGLFAPSLALASIQPGRLFPL